MSLKSRIQDLCKKAYYSDRPLVHSGEIERMAMALNYKPSHADRRCRDLVKEGVIIGEDVMTTRGTSSKAYKINPQYL